MSSQDTAAALASLIELGFSEDESQAALAKFMGASEHAANYLFIASDAEKATLVNNWKGQGPQPEQGGFSLAGIAAATEPLKMILLVRTDLEMTTGKMCAQCAHAAVDLVLSVEGSGDVMKKSWLAAWHSDGCAKITLAVKDEAMLMELEAKARAQGIPAKVVHDAGRTQVASGTATVLGIGPAPNSLVDSVTGGLPLL